MRAKEVYEKNRREIKIISDAMKKTGRPGHAIGRPDDKVYIHSAQPFEPELEILSSQVVGGEIIGNHTMCQVTPIGTRDLKLVCVQTEGGREKEIARCVDVISEQIVQELTDIAIEQDETVKDLIRKVRNGQITDEEASEQLKLRLAKSYRDEQEILRYYEKFRNTNCGRVVKTISKIETQGSKIIDKGFKTEEP